MAIKRVDLSWINVSDLEKAKNFFVDILGFKLNVHEKKFGWMEVQASEGGMLLGIAQVDKCSSEKPGTNAIITCTVDSLEEAIKIFQNKGVTFKGSIIEVPGHVKMIFFTDPDGNTFQLVEKIS